MNTKLGWVVVLTGSLALIVLLIPQPISLASSVESDGVSILTLARASSVPAGSDSAAALRSLIQKQQLVVQDGINFREQQAVQDILREYPWVYLVVVNSKSDFYGEFDPLIEALQTDPALLRHRSDTGDAKYLLIVLDEAARKYAIQEGLYWENLEVDENELVAAFADGYKVAGARSPGGLRAVLNVLDAAEARYLRAKFIQTWSIPGVVFAILLVLAGWQEWRRRRIQIEFLEQLEVFEDAKQGADAVIRSIDHIAEELTFETVGTAGHGATATAAEELRGLAEAVIFKAIGARSILQQIEERIRQRSITDWYSAKLTEELRAALTSPDALYRVEMSPPEGASHVEQLLQQLRGGLLKGRSDQQAYVVLTTQIEHDVEELKSLRDRFNLQRKQAKPRLEEQHQRWRVSQESVNHLWLTDMSCAGPFLFTSAKSALVYVGNLLDQGSNLLAGDDPVGACTLADQARWVLDKLDWIAERVAAVRGEYLPISAEVISLLNESGNTVAWVHVSASQLAADLNKMIEQLQLPEADQTQVDSELAQWAEQVRQQHARLTLAIRLEASRLQDLVDIKTAETKVLSERQILSQELHQAIADAALGSLSTVEMLKEQGYDPDSQIVSMGQFALHLFEQLGSGEIEEAQKTHEQIVQGLEQIQVCIDQTRAAIEGFDELRKETSKRRNSVQQDLASAVKKLEALTVTYSEQALARAASEVAANGTLSSCLSEAEPKLRSSEQFEEQSVQKFLAGQVLASRRLLDNSESAISCAEELLVHVEQAETALAQQVSSAKQAVVTCRRESEEASDVCNFAYVLEDAKTALKEGKRLFSEGEACTTAAQKDPYHALETLKQASSKFSEARRLAEEYKGVYDSAAQTIINAEQRVNSAEQEIVRCSSIPIGGTTVDLSSAREELQEAEAHLARARQHLINLDYNAVHREVKECLSDCEEAETRAHQAQLNAQPVQQTEVVQVVSSDDSNSYLADQPTTATVESGSGYGTIDNEVGSNATYGTIDTQTGSDATYGSL